MKAKEKLKKLGMYHPFLEWVGGRTIEDAVRDCHRGDWLGLLAGILEIDNRKIILAAGLCVNTVRNLIKEEKSINAVDVAIKYGNREASDEELKEAFYAADTTNSDGYEAADAAYYASYVAFYYYDAEEYKKNHLETANICRKILGEEIIKKFNEL